MGRGNLAGHSPWVTRVRHLATKPPLDLATEPITTILATKQVEFEIKKKR